MAAPPQTMAADFHASATANSFWLRKEITNAGSFAPFINTTGGARLKSDDLDCSSSRAETGVGAAFSRGHALVRDSGGGPRLGPGDAGASERGRDFRLLAHLLTPGRSRAPEEFDDLRRGTPLRKGDWRRTAASFMCELSARASRGAYGRTWTPGFSVSVPATKSASSGLIERSSMRRRRPERHRGATEKR